MLWLMAIGLLLPSLSLGQLLTQDDPRDSLIPLLAGQSLYEWALPRNSVFWKADSDGNEWRKDSYGTIWKKEAGQDPFKKESWFIDGYDHRQARRISADTVMQFHLNRDGTIKPESVRQLTLIYPSDSSPSTLPAHLRKAELSGSGSGAAQIQKQIPQANLQIRPPR
jgi:hypothetical protein